MRQGNAACARRGPDHARAGAGPRRRGARCGTACTAQVASPAVSRVRARARVDRIRSEGARHQV